jgi:hypothetical protein
LFILPTDSLLRGLCAQDGGAALVASGAIVEVGGHELVGFRHTLRALEGLS